jgi:catechol 2,3-dioxygenase-like lactoylglutathione lyase family enzyme
LPALVPCCIVGSVKAPSPLRLDHVVVPVHDAREARRFYGELLGLPLVAALSGEDWGGRSWLMMFYGLGTGGQHLVVAAFDGLDCPVVQPFPRDARHHAVSVDSAADWQSWRARLAAAGASFWEENHGDQRSLYVVDPSSNVIEITTPETPPFADRSEQADATPDCIVDRWVDRVTSGR